MEKGKRGIARRVILSVLLAALLLVICIWAFDAIFHEADDAQADLVEEAVRRALVTCYAVEGQYPSDAAVLTEGYGLLYDEERFIVVLDGFASNVMPSIRVLRRGADAA